MSNSPLVQAVRDALVRRGDAPVVDDLRGDRLSGAELLAEVDTCARLLRGLGVRRLALLADNGVAWLVHALAAQAVDVSLLPLPPFFSDDQLRHVLHQAQPDLLVCEEPARNDQLGLTVVGYADGPRALHWVRLPRPSEPVAGDELISFTSGSTGHPKGTRLPADALLAVVTSMVEATGARPGDRHLCSLPLAVLLELTGGVYRALLSGGVALVPSLTRLGTAAGQGVDGERLAELLLSQRAASAVLVPETLGALVGVLEDRSAVEHEMRFLGVGGAVTSPGLLARADALGLPVFEGYGLTECCSVVCLNTAAARRTGSVGRPLPHGRVSVADDGELLVEGALLRGRLGEPDRQVDAPWPTGDLGSIDDDGFVRLRGRKDNLLRTASGRNVSPEWIEALLLDLPRIRQAVVLGDGLPRPYAVVVPRDPDDPPVEDDLLSVNAELPGYARLEALVVAPDPFTVANGCWTATGRPRRAAVAAAWSHSRYRSTLTKTPR